MKLAEPISSVKGVGKVAENALKRLGISTVSDLINYYPKRYDDFSNLEKIISLKPGAVTVKAKITSAKGRYVRRGMHITEAIASDESASVRLVWFNQPYRSNSIKNDEDYYISGDFGLRRGRFSILNPSIEIVSEFPVNTARIIPVYRQTKELGSSQIRKTIKNALSSSTIESENLPKWILNSQKLTDYHSAIWQIHFPDSNEQLDIAKKRLAFNEVFELSLSALLNKHEFQKNTSAKILFDEKLAKKFVSSLPFKLTNSQRLASWQILKDLNSDTPMNRLLEGDVGSGKTVVAALSSAMAIAHGFQVVFMAPTEILAKQHAESLYELMKSIGMETKVGLLIGSLKKSAKQLVHEKIKNNELSLIVGTHALISDSVAMNNLGLVIVDEQHRFGVEQRKKLQTKAKHMPHVLHMSATPIPRSLALTLYGELDLSILDELPAGRKSIITKICSPNSRKQLTSTVDKQLKAGRQVYIVCPLIEEGENNPQVSVEVVYKRVESEHKDFRVGVLHGKLSSLEKDEIMQKFIDKKIDVLVSTTVIEVGVDVPNASVMVIEGAERFGLAQIHQLRGRVGRGVHQSYCYLVASDSRAPTHRLESLERTNDGFKLAEIDLKLRGPGAIYGKVQHGAIDLRIANLTDAKLIRSAREMAAEFIRRKEHLENYPLLDARVKQLRKITNLN